METQTQSSHLDVLKVTLQLRDNAELELVKAKGAVSSSKAVSATSMGWLAHLSKMLTIFEAIDKSNKLTNSVHTELNKAAYLKQIIYNSVKGCSTLDELNDYLSNLKKNAAGLSKIDPALSGLISYLGDTRSDGKTTTNGEITNAINSFLSQAGCQKNTATYQNWAQEELPLFQNMFDGLNLEGSAFTKANQAFAKNAEGESKTLNSAMSTLTSMSVDSLSDPGASSGIENRDT